jgi:acetylornithine aminotransferase
LCAVRGPGGVRAASPLRVSQHVPPASPPGARTAGEGCKLYDEAGRAYVDWAAGIAVNALGHSDPELAAVVAAQMRGGVQHLSNLFHSWEPLRLARALVESTAHFDRAFLCNSGTEANEAALKFARKVSLVAATRAAAAKAAGGAAAPASASPSLPPAFSSFGCKSAVPSACFTRGGVCGCWPQASANDVIAGLKTEVLAFKGSFHGRSLGSLSATHKPAIRQPFAPLPPDVRFARFNNMGDVAAALAGGGWR